MTIKEHADAFVRSMQLRSRIWKLLQKDLQASANALKEALKVIGMDKELIAKVYSDFFSKGTDFIVAVNLNIMDEKLSEGLLNLDVEVLEEISVFLQSTAGMAFIELMASSTFEELQKIGNDLLKESKQQLEVLMKDAIASAHTMHNKRKPETIMVECPCGCGEMLPGTMIDLGNVGELLKNPDLLREKLKDGFKGSPLAESFGADLGPLAAEILENLRKDSPREEDIPANVRAAVDRIKDLLGGASPYIGDDSPEDDPDKGIYYCACGCGVRVSKPGGIWAAEELERRHKRWRQST